MVSADYFLELEDYLHGAISNNAISLKRIKVIFAKAKLVDFLNDLDYWSKELELSSQEYIKHRYEPLFIIIKNWLVRYKESKNIEKLTITNNFLDIFYHHLLLELSEKKFCPKCFNILDHSTYFPFGEEHLMYSCETCLGNIRTADKTNYLLLYILYLYTLQENLDKKGISISFHSSFKSYLSMLFLDIYESLSLIGDVRGQITIFQFLKHNNIEDEKTPSTEVFLRELLRNLIITLTKQNFVDFFEGKEYYIKNFGDIPENSLDEMKMLFIEVFIKSLKRGNYPKLLEIKKLIVDSDFVSIEQIRSHRDFENFLYEGLSYCLNINYFDDFTNLVDLASLLDVHIKPEKIPRRLDRIFECVESCVRSGGDLGGIIDVLRFTNNYSLAFQDLSPKQIKIVDNLKKSAVFINNLNDLFGTVDNSFIYLIHKEMPNRLYNTLINWGDTTYFGNQKGPIGLIEEMVIPFLKSYVIYGLSVKKLGNINYFIEKYQQYLKEMQDKHTKIVIDKHQFFKLEIKSQDPDDSVKTHLISQSNIKKNLEKMKDKNNYYFYTFSMVLLGGLGPEGHGFSYSTPRGELVEICSDRKESRAIIIKFKKYLKDKFLNKLSTELLKRKISDDLIQEVTYGFLNNIIRVDEYVDITKKKSLLEHIESYLFSNMELKELFHSEKHLMTQISDSISVILRPIDLIDQFKTRMKLVEEDKIRSEDIPKLTRLKEKSHYDVLRERFFFQYIIDKFEEIYFKKKYELLKKKR